MRRFVVAVGVLVLCLAGMSAVAQEVTIGVDFSTTGASASLGIPNKNAMLLAPTVYGGVHVKYIYLDDASDPTIAVQNVKRLISENNIDLLIGPSVTPPTIAVTDTVAAAKVPILTMGSTSRLILPMDDKKKWVFKVVPNDEMLMNLQRYGIHVFTQAIYGLVLAQPQIIVQAAIMPAQQPPEQAQTG